MTAGPALLAALLLVLGGAGLRAQEAQPVAAPPAEAQPEPGDIVIDEAAPVVPAVAAPVLRADDLANIPPAVALAAVPPSPPVRGDQEVNLEVGVPSECTVFEAVGHVFAQLPALMPEYTWASNVLGHLQATPATFATPAGKTIPWDEALAELLKPQGLDFIEDGRLVRVGPAEVIEAQRANLAQERLARNHRKIVVAFDGQALKFALENIQSQAGISMNYNYMEPADLNPVVVPPPVLVDGGQAQTPEGGINADTLQAQAAAQAASATKKVTYSTPAGMPQEWRMVLREVLDPCGYDFIEVGGVVRPMKKERVAQWHAEQLAAKPLVTRFARVYHADPEIVVKQLNEMHLTRHPKAFIAVSRPKDDNTKVFSGSQAGIAIPSGTQIGASQVGGSGAFSSLTRPRTPPGILFADVEENIERIERTLRLIDIRERQVLIEALVLDVNDDSLKELGVNWSGIDGMTLGSLFWTGGREDASARASGNQATWSRETSDTSSESSGDSLSRDLIGGGKTVARDYARDSTSTRGTSRETLSGNERVTEHAKGTLFEGVLGPLDISATLRMLQEDSDTKILASPVLVIGDHAEAVIQVGETEPVPISTLAYLNDNANNVAEEVEWQILTTGVILWVSPEITGDGRQVRLSVHPQITEPGERVPGPNNTSYPRVSSRELDTRVTVPSGDTLLLGGLITSRETEYLNRVPFLGNIPLLGRLFRYRSTNKAQRNLLIMIRPTILDDDQPDSGFEAPAMRIVEPLMEGAGKTLVPPVIEDPMRDRERRWFGLGAGKGQADGDVIAEE